MTIRINHLTEAQDNIVSGALLGEFAFCKMLKTLLVLVNDRIFFKDLSCI